MIIFKTREALQQHLSQYKGKKIALTICEDLWDIKEDPLYTFQPYQSPAQGEQQGRKSLAASRIQSRL